MDSSYQSKYNEGMIDDARTANEITQISYWNDLDFRVSIPKN